MRNSEATSARRRATNYSRRRAATLEKTRGERSRARSSRFQRHDVKRNARSELATHTQRHTQRILQHTLSRSKRSGRRVDDGEREPAATHLVAHDVPMVTWSDTNSPAGLSFAFSISGSRPPCYSVVRALFFWLFLSAYLRERERGRRSGGALGFKVSWINPKERTKKKE